MLAALLCAVIAGYGGFLIWRRIKQGQAEARNGRESIDIDKAGKFKIDASTGFGLVIVGVGGFVFCFHEYRLHLEDEVKKATTDRKNAEDALKAEQDAHKKDESDSDAALQKAKSDLDVAQKSLDTIRRMRDDLTARNEELTRQAAVAREVTETVLTAMDKNSLSDQQRKEFDSHTQEVTDLNKSLSFLRIVPTRWPKLEGQKAVAIFQIYSTAFEKDQELGRGPGIFDFDSQKYWPLKGDYQGNIYDGKNERLNSEIVDLICQAIDRAVNQGVSPKDAIDNIRNPPGFDVDKELLRELAEFSYAMMKIKAMAGRAMLLVRGFADGQEGPWDKPLDFPVPTELQVHRNAGSDPMTAEINLVFQSAESPFQVGRKVGNSTMYTNKDLPNLRAASTAKILAALMTACPGQESGQIPVEILDGWVYPNHDVADRKVRLFLAIYLKSA